MASLQKNKVAQNFCVLLRGISLYLFPSDVWQHIIFKYL